MRKIRGCLLAGTIWLTTILSPAIAEDRITDVAANDQVCATTACRTGGFEIMVNVDEQTNSYMAIPVSHSPYVLDDRSILIFPGETLAFKFNVKNGKLGKPEFVKAFLPRTSARIDIDGKLAANPLDAGLPPEPKKDGDIDMAALPKDSLVLSYGEIENGKSGMMLLVRNSLTKTVKFEDRMFVIKPGQEGYASAYTSTCSVRAGSSNYETWPHAIGPMILSEFHFDKDPTCR